MTTVQGILPQQNTTLIKIREESGDPGMVLPLTQLCMRPPRNRQNFLSFPFDCLFCNCQRISQQDRKRHPFSFWALANCQWKIWFEIRESWSLLANCKILRWVDVGYKTTLPPQNEHENQSSKAHKSTIKKQCHKINNQKNNLK